MKRSLQQQESIKFGRFKTKLIPKESLTAVQSNLKVMVPRYGFVRCRVLQVMWCRN